MNIAADRPIPASVSKTGTAGPESTDRPGLSDAPDRATFDRILTARRERAGQGEQPTETTRTDQPVAESPELIRQTGTRVDRTETQATASPACRTPIKAPAGAPTSRFESNTDRTVRPEETAAVPNTTQLTAGSRAEAPVHSAPVPRQPESMTEQRIRTQATLMPPAASPVSRTEATQTWQASLPGSGVQLTAARHDGPTTTATGWSIAVTTTAADASMLSRQSARLNDRLMERLPARSIKVSVAADSPLSADAVSAIESNRERQHER